MCTPKVKEARDAAASKIDYTKEQLAEGNASGKFMEHVHGGGRSIDGALRPIGEEVQRWGDALARLTGQNKGESGDISDVSDTQAVNYSKDSKSGSSKVSNKKGMKKTGEGTGLTKSGTFYSTK
jgi:hypothetical protein